MKRYDWNQYCKRLVAGMCDLAGLGASREPNERLCVVLDSKTRELVALAAAVSLHSERYIALHAANARRLGADEGEIGQAVCVAATVSAKVTLAHSMRVIQASERR
jgi:AhpD family alkylhydroperoxidase